MTAAARHILVVAALAAAAAAQTEPPVPQEPTPRLQGEPHEHDGGGEGFWRRDHLTGDWGGLRSWLRAYGITPELFATTDASVVAAGGVDPGGTAVRTLVDATLTLATEPLFGWSGGTFYVDLQWQRGDDGSLDTGDLQRYSDIDHSHEFEEVAMLWFEQALCGNTLFVRLGKNDVNNEFDVVGHADHFLHSSFGHSPTVLAMPTYPDTSFGAQVFWRPGSVYAGAGVYDGAAQAGVKTGEHGPSTLFRSSADLFAIGEGGMQWQGDRPGRCGLGLWHHTGDFARFDGGIEQGTAGVYAVAEQSLWLVDDGERGLGGFVMYGWADPQVSGIEHHFGAGLEWAGPWVQRPRDVVGLGATFASFSQAPGAGLSGRGELAVELFYELRLSPWLAVRPVLTWIDDPGGLPDVEDALVLTLRTSVTF